MSWAETKTINSNPQLPLNKLIATQVGTLESEDIVSTLSTEASIREYNNDKLFDGNIVSIPTMYTSNIKRSSGDTGTANMKDAVRTIHRPNGDIGYIIITSTISQKKVDSSNTNTTQEYIRYGGYGYIYFPSNNETVELGDMLHGDYFVYLYRNDVSAKSGQDISIYKVIENKEKVIYLTHQIVTHYGYASSNYWYPTRCIRIGLLEVTNDDVIFTEIKRLKMAYNGSLSNNGIGPISLDVRYVGSGYVSAIAYSSGVSKAFEETNGIIVLHTSSGSYYSCNEYFIDIKNKTLVNESGWGGGTSTAKSTLSGCDSNKVNWNTSYAIACSSTITGDNIDDNYNMHKFRFTKPSDSSDGKLEICYIESTYDSENREMIYNETITFTDVLEKYGGYNNSNGVMSYYYVDDYMAIYNGNLYCLPIRFISTEYSRYSNMNWDNATSYTNVPYYVHYNKTLPYVIKDVYGDNPIKENFEPIALVDSLKHYNLINTLILKAMGRGSFSSNTSISQVSQIFENLCFSANYYSLYTRSSSITNVSGSPINVWADGRVNGDTLNMKSGALSAEEVIELIDAVYSLSYIDVAATKDLKIIIDEKYVSSIVNADYQDGVATAIKNGTVRIYKKIYEVTPFTISY